MSDHEVHNLPLVARNPYNFALVQPGVTGIENVEFGVPRLAANGAAMRINYQIDGNTNTEKDRAGLRLLPMSEVMIQEVKVVTTGFAPEFGQTMGMVYNAVTPSGTNTFHGEGSYLFRRKPFSAFPFFFGCGSTTIAANCPARRRQRRASPQTKVDTGTADVGGPIVKNKLFFYAGWEQTRRDLSSGSLITVRSGDRRGGRRQAAAGGGAERPDREVQDRQGRLPDQQRQPRDGPLGAVPQRRAVQQRRRHQRRSSAPPTSSTRWIRSAGQVVSSFGSSKLNEFRFQYAHRHQSSVGEQRLRHRSGDHDQHAGDRRFGGAGRRHRPGQRRLRLQAEHHAGDRQLHLHPRRRTATSSASTCSTSTTSAPARRSSSTPSRRWPPTSPRRPARAPFGYSTMTQITGEPGLQHGDQHLQRVRAGRLADRADA